MRQTDHVAFGAIVEPILGPFILFSNLARQITNQSRFFWGENNRLHIARRLPCVETKHHRCAANQHKSNGEATLLCQFTQAFQAIFYLGLRKCCHTDIIQQRIAKVFLPSIEYNQPPGLHHYLAAAQSPRAQFRLHHSDFCLPSPWPANEKKSSGLPLDSKFQVLFSQSLIAALMMV